MRPHARVERLEGRQLCAAGDRDLTFGGGDGAAEFAGAGSAHAIAFTEDNFIVVAGSTPFESGGGGLLLRVVRYRPDGMLDETFGAGGDDGDGRVTVEDVVANGGSTVLALDPDGRVLVAVEGTYLVRFSADGVLDTDFGEGGKAFAYFGH